MKTTSPLFTIQQVSARCGVSKSTLRFWEKKFSDRLWPIRSHGGQRRYSTEHIALIELIKRTKEEGLSLDEVRERIHQREVAEPLESQEASLDALAERIAYLVKYEVSRFFCCSRKAEGGPARE